MALWMKLQSQWKAGWTGSMDQLGAESASGGGREESAGGTSGNPCSVVEEESLKGFLYSLYNIYIYDILLYKRTHMIQYNVSIHVCL